MDVHSITGQLALYRYHLPVRSTTASGKSGLFFVLHTDRQYSYGEYAPHPATFNIPLPQLTVELQHWLNVGDIVISALPPHLQWGFTMALLWQFPELLAPPRPLSFPLTVPINALITDLSNEETIVQTCNAGYSILKLKVGRFPIAEEIQHIHRLHQHCPEARLRLDANGKLSLDAAAALLTAVRHLPIDYIEDPTPNVEDYTSLFNTTGIAIALDETLVSFLRQSKCTTCCPPWLAAFVVKPPRYCTIALLREIIETAHTLGVPLIFSAAYESSLTLHWLAVAHHQWNPSSSLPAAGFDTFRLFPHQLSPWNVSAGSVTLNAPIPPLDSLAWQYCSLLGKWEVRLYWDAHKQR